MFCTWMEANWKVNIWFIMTFLCEYYSVRRVEYFDYAYIESISNKQLVQFKRETWSIRTSETMKSYFTLFTVSVGFFCMQLQFVQNAKPVKESELEVHEKLGKICETIHKGEWRKMWVIRRGKLNRLRLTFAIIFAEMKTKMDRSTSAVIKRNQTRIQTLCKSVWFLRGACGIQV